MDNLDYFMIGTLIGVVVPLLLVKMALSMGLLVYKSNTKSEDGL